MFQRVLFGLLIATITTSAGMDRNSSDPLCAHILEKGGCTGSDGISSIWVVNDRKDHAVMVTVHQHLWANNTWVDGERVVDVRAGEELFFDCRPVGGEQNVYTVAACELR